MTHQFSRAVLQLFSVLGDHDRHEPHYYLPIVGARPEHQGHGIGSALSAMWREAAW